MLDLIVGSQKNPYAREVLTEEFKDSRLDGTLYIGYPILASVEGPISVDGLLCSKQNGLTIFDFQPFDNLQEISERQDQVHAAVFRKLFAIAGLRRNRSQLAVSIVVVTVSPTADAVEEHGNVIISPPTHLQQVSEGGEAISDDLLELVNASIERVSTLKPQAKRPQVNRDDSRGAIIEQIEKEIANLDSWQKRAAIESPDGPQRIRGLAGSGKTIILALKAAYLHAQNPDWNIALTFHTRSLYQQLRDLVMRFSFEAMNDEPNWQQLRILHTWGSSYYPGIYSTLAAHADMPVRDFTYGKNTFGYENAFDGVCNELLMDIQNRDISPVFDAILIDEAQDLPKEFFHLCYTATPDPHRIVWAYDELQNLTQEAMPPIKELFGYDEGGQPRVERLSTAGSPREDIILPKCYRNPPWTLSVAHALGFGIYRDEGLVQFFDNAQLWEEIGYEVIRGEIAPGQQVTLRRSRDSYPDYFEALLDRDDSVCTKIFESKLDQASWIADQIFDNVTKDELRLQDILVVLCNPLAQKRDSAIVMEALSKHDISSHLAGVTSSVDTLFREDSIALSAIYRAKGNEAPMVYVLGSEYGAVSALELIKRRNVLFTAITRSRAWVRICGVGSGMAAIAEEVQNVVENNFKLEFTVPTPPQLERMRRIHRDMPAQEKSRISKTEKDFRGLLKRIEKGELPSDVLSKELVEQLERITNGGGEH